MRKLALLALVVLFGTAFVACGDDDDTTAGDTPTTNAPATTAGDYSKGGGSGDTPVDLEGKVNDEGTKALSGDELELELDDFYFKPTFVTASGGETIKVELENEGDAPHTFTIDSLDVDEEVAPGAKVEVEITLPATGDVVYYCRFHQGGGMQGGFAIG